MYAWKLNEQYALVSEGNADIKEGYGFTLVNKGNLRCRCSLEKLVEKLCTAYRDSRNPLLLLQKFITFCLSYNVGEKICVARFFTPFILGEYYTLGYSYDNSSIYVQKHGDSVVGMTGFDGSYSNPDFKRYIVDKRLGLTDELYDIVMPFCCSKDRAGKFTTALHYFGMEEWQVCSISGFVAEFISGYFARWCNEGTNYQLFYEKVAPRLQKHGYNTDVRYTGFSNEILLDLWRALVYDTEIKSTTLKKLAMNICIHANVDWSSRRWVCVAKYCNICWAYELLGFPTSNMPLITPHIMKDNILKWDFRAVYKDLMPFLVPLMHRVKLNKVYLTYDLRRAFGTTILQCELVSPETIDNVKHLLGCLELKCSYEDVSLSTAGDVIWIVLLEASGYVVKEYLSSRVGSDDNYIYCDFPISAVLAGVYFRFTSDFIEKYIDLFFCIMFYYNVHLGLTDLKHPVCENQLSYKIGKDTVRLMREKQYGV